MFCFGGGRRVHLHKVRGGGVVLPAVGDKGKARRTGIPALGFVARTGGVQTGRKETPCGSKRGGGGKK